MRPADVRKVIEIGESCDLSPWSHRDYLDEMGRSDSILLTAKTTAHEIAGFIVSRRVPSASQEHVRDLEIYNIGVVHDLRRKHIGTTLLVHTLEICRRGRIGSAWLEVRASNDRAIRFYEQHGFRKMAVRRDFYRDPAEDGISMQLDLAGRR